MIISDNAQGSTEAWSENELTGFAFNDEIGYGGLPGFRSAILCEDGEPREEEREEDGA